MTIAEKIQMFLERSSWIRKMFEQGAQLKAKHGVENVFDFSLGNPNLEPPARFKEILIDVAKAPGLRHHGYMPNIGYPGVRQAVAEFLSSEQDFEVTADEVIMTCGAAGALNVILKAILGPGDEVITPAPYFVEYGFYVDNHGGVLKTVPTRSDFTLDLEAIRAAMTPRTKAVLVNSPNNPSGQIYSKESLLQLGMLLTEEGRQRKRTIYLISDEPYRKITFDGAEVPSLFSCYTESMIATSYSKDLSIPGERIGFLAVHPQATHKGDLLAGMALANRILGYVNAPAFMQRVIQSLQGVSVDAAIYQKKRDLLCDGLSACGYEFVKPKGAFYLFPKTPIQDDVAFVQALQEELILTVPGSGFGSPGYFRIAFCVDDDTIKRALPGFERVRKRFSS
ncbi:MAG: pyridoxal phosphate-dependent aminotransferase [Deltaproteobacteria bacterium]|nr:pyridoxal phosphate-dependent aminotransferase [Deltaproteobacteria bacterium]MBW2074503.1 pyridoxal phosphate-dependent aminotransferase [Deltaproteobacteria bacterium]RLB82636.1 MAG: pyridoxal phosphate-dependent aminotransferase [Deltaproteobacteria bacterium]